MIQDLLIIQEHILPEKLSYLRNLQALLSEYLVPEPQRVGAKAGILRLEILTPLARLS
jgi:hypothetical protein